MSQSFWISPYVVLVYPWASDPLVEGQCGMPKATAWLNPTSDKVRQTLQNEPKRPLLAQTVQTDTLSEYLSSLWYPNPLPKCYLSHRWAKLKPIRCLLCKNSLFVGSFNTFGAWSLYSFTLRPFFTLRIVPSHEGHPAWSTVSKCLEGCELGQTWCFPSKCELW